MRTSYAAFPPRRAASYTAFPIDSESILGAFPQMCGCRWTGVSDPQKTISDARIRTQLCCSAYCFVSGITLLYALWKGSNWSFSISNDIRAVSCVLSIMGERAPWIRRFRDEFDALTEATIAALQNASCEAGVAERNGTVPAAPGFTTFDGLKMTDTAALEMVRELSEWFQS
jgi:hypothetical protein